MKGVINSCFRSNRKQTTQVSNGMFKGETTFCGVPQGSFLGPLSFILYRNNIYKTPPH